jgi:hypothetical protein
MKGLRLSARGVKYVVLIALVLWLASCEYRDHNLDAGFATISNGMSQDAVTQLLGRPRSVLDCSPGEFSPLRELSDCFQTYVYASAWAPLNPWYPVVWFDQHKRVIGKFEISSP